MRVIVIHVCRYVIICICFYLGEADKCKRGAAQFSIDIYNIVLLCMYLIILLYHYYYYYYIIIYFILFYLLLFILFYYYLFLFI